MAIFAPNHRPIGKTTHAAGTAGAHVRYITRAYAASLVMAEHMPSGPDAARAWIDERELTDRKNGRVCDKLMLPLPIELDAAGRADLVREFMHEIGGGRVAWMAGIHDRGKDQHNPHAQVLLRDKDFETGKRVFGTSEKGSTDRIREAWETAINRSLEREGLDIRVDRRSLAEQGIDREPGIHIGPNVLAMEDRGIRPVSVPQEVANDRVVNWPEIDQGRTRADRQREIEAGNRERERDRDRDKSGDRSAGLAPAVEIEAEPVKSMDPPTMPHLAQALGGASSPDPSMPTPAPVYVPNFVLVPATPEQLHQLEDVPQLVPQREQLDEVPEPVRAYVPNFVLVPDVPEVQPELAPEMTAKRAQERGPEMGGPTVAPMEPEATQRASYEAEPELKTPDLGRWAGMIAAARERLAVLGDRLDVAFGRVRDHVLKPQAEPRPTPEIKKPAERLTGQGRDVNDNGAVILEAMKPPTPEPKRGRSVAEELLEAGRRHREQNPKPDLDLDRDFSPRRRRMPWEPPL